MDGALIAGTGEEEQSCRNSANSNNDITTADLHRAENAAAHQVRALHPREESAKATSTLEASEQACDRGVSLHCRLFLSSTCGVTDLGHSFGSFIQGAFTGKYDLQQSS